MATSLFTTLKGLKGNARGVVLTEALWGIPFNLYAPYVSVYMLALGLDDKKIGLIASLGLVGQILSAILGGAITDKFGRKRTTLIADLFSWSVPCLIWAISQNFTYFVIAALINSTWRISMVSWGCLLVEDTDPKQLVEIYTWIYIAGTLSVFFAPLAGVLINAYSLVPTQRALYAFAFVMMTAKFVTMNRMVKETRQGMVRMSETRGQSLFQLLGEYHGVFRQILAARQTLYTIGIMMIMSAAQLVNNTFWSILVTQRLHIPAQHIAYYPFARSLIMLVFFFLVTPRVRDMHFRNPMLVGLAGFITSQALLITMPEKSYLLLLLSTLIDACSYAAVGTQLDRMLVVTVDPEERARIVAIIYVMVIAVTSPFGWIAGELSSISKVLPFALNIVLFAAAAILVLRAAQYSKKQSALALENPLRPVEEL